MPENFSQSEVEELLARQGYTRIHRRNGAELEVIQDRIRLRAANRGRLVEALEAAFKTGRGHLKVYPLEQTDQPWRFSADFALSRLRYPLSRAHAQPVFLQLPHGRV